MTYAEIERNFERDVLAIRQRTQADVPSTVMRLRSRRSWGPENSLVEMSVARRQRSSLSLMLYSHGANRHDRPIVVAPVDPMADIESIPDRSIGTVIGWPAQNRAVLVQVADFELISISPCEVPMRHSGRPPAR